MSIRRWWAARRAWQQLLTLAGAALLLALLAETLCNARAIATRGLSPVSVPLAGFACETDAVFNRDSSGIHLDSAGNHVVDLVLPDPGVTTETVAVALTGAGTVSVSVLIEDQANAYTPAQVYTIVCLPGDPALRYCYAGARSAGAVRELRLRFKAETDDPYTVALVTLNAQFPLQWQPARMGLSWLAAMGLLCAAFRPLRAWKPGRWARRAIIALPLIATMGLCALIAGWIEPETPLFSGITDEQAMGSRTDIYAVLFETLRAGRLAVDREPDGSLLGLANPYDQSERVAKKISFPFDYSYYNGQYYIYYGVAPVLSVYAPYRAITGRVPTSRDATLLMAWLAVGLIGWAVCGLARRYAPQAGPFAVSLGCATAVYASGAMLLFSSADFYYLAELSYVCFAAGAVALGLSAAGRPRGWLSRLEYALCGVSFTLTAMSRPSALPMLMAFLAPLFICELLRRRARLAEAAAFLVPAALGVGAILWYNWARFGSVLDFGARHQLTVTDVHWRHASLQELPAALYHYLLEPLSFTNRFPYLAVSYHTLPTVGRYVFTLSNAGVLVFPVTWALLLMPLASPAGATLTPLARRERRWTLLLPLFVSLPLMLVSYGVAGAILRYTCDFRLFYALAGAVCALALMDRPQGRERRALAAICAGLCVASLWVGAALLLDNERDYILKRSPQIYYALQRMFFPY